MKRCKLKKTAAILLSGVLAFGALTAMPLTAGAAETAQAVVQSSETYTSGDYKYQLLDDGTAKITDYSGKTTNLEIPSKLDGYTVTSLGYMSFAQNSYFRSITIPDTVTEIGMYAFLSCKNISELNLPNSVTTIGFGAFDGCEKLAVLTIPESVTSIGSCAFSGCGSLTSLVIPGTVESIGSDAFSRCENIESIEIGEGVFDIDTSAFQYCTSLKSVYIPSTLTDVGSYVFNHCTALTNVEIADGAATIGMNMFDTCTALESIVIPKSVSSIGMYAFNDCTSLKDVIISNGVLTIGSHAFYKCESLKFIIIPKSVTGIGDTPLGYYSYTAAYDNFTIAGYSGSAAETYADENGFVFIDIENQNYNHTDAATGINVIAKANANLSVSKVTDSESIESVGKLFGGNTNILLYDISLMKNGKAVQPEGTAQVKIPFENPTGLVYRVESDGTLTDMNATQIDGCLVFYTDHFSRYVVSNIASEVLVSGDVNEDGDIDISDATAIQKAVAQIITLTDSQQTAADVNSDGIIDISDATMIQKYVAKIITAFTATK